MRPIVAILSATVWISLHEFIRNQLILIDHWTAHYTSMGLTFPGDPVNGAVWGIWSMCFSVVIFFIARRSSVLETGILAWSVGFVLMWLVVGNLGMLPLSILPYAIPWSMVEVFGAVWIVKKVA
ncbi:MAG: hypothetical protein IPO05_14145 [Flavobacteriales bacterium]|nr:hypothetical protein [Flavobacteriales bacterium]MBK9514730.1 hypothetical protein [Flavobacteriales bacterium]